MHTHTHVKHIQHTLIHITSHQSGIQYVVFLSWFSVICSILFPHNSVTSIIVVCSSVKSGYHHPTIILQVTLPTRITQRYGHSVVMFGTGPNLRVLVIFGGRNGKRQLISETTLMLLCKSLSPYLSSGFIMWDTIHFTHVLHVHVHVHFLPALAY